MKLIDRIKSEVSEVTSEHTKLIEAEAKRVAVCWTKSILREAKEGKSSTYFCEMTCSLSRHFPFATDLTTNLYLSLIADHFRSEGLTVSAPYRIQNRNGYQAQIDVSWTT